ncbi:MAG: glycerophosphodiester phosphodiesterase [Candidatus Dadabacteria bacterium]|nr:glycerophosphodiester phosphodiesterase [Candidatus Dadabacteria bacterium]NIS07849.1 glycerophosphodiester phosphodiesterase [Candidatus Dadabacteria bacterium]NIV42821.1 glycerophosphodiester phosphodiesterase [Candidatus Dadabacteria bacterium]NIY21637.1 glycerophosphodiester phosphodiesterase [Candidatus Dadabacteria bacterium]
MPKHPFFNIRKNDQVLIIAHRGGPGLNPENTLTAFKHAEHLGADAIELDIHTSKDGQIVIMHDDTIDRTTNGSGSVRDFTLSELKGFDAGYNWTNDGGKSFPFRGKGIKIPTLSEVMSEINDAGIIIEIKQEEPSLIKPLSDLIKEHGLENRVIVASFSSKALLEFRSVMHEVATSTTKSEAVRFFFLNQFYLAGFYNPSPAAALQVPEHYKGKRVITERFVSTARKQNLEVHAWTINEVEDMKRLIDIGVEGIVTDYPDRLLRLLGRL